MLLHYPANVVLEVFPLAVKMELVILMNVLPYSSVLSTLMAPPLVLSALHQ